MKVGKIKCGKKTGCVYDDEVEIIISPAWCESIAYVFERLAIDAEQYAELTTAKEKADLFRQAHEKWRKERGEKDKDG